MSTVILGNGLLGTEMNRQTGWDVVARSREHLACDARFDITQPNTFAPYLLESGEDGRPVPKYSHAVNCIAYTDTYSEDSALHWDVNYQGVNHLIEFCNTWNIVLVHISTDYLYSNAIEFASERDVPVHCRTWYGYTKLLADGLVQLASAEYLLIRATHKRIPFQYAQAWTTQTGNFDYVTVISEIIIELIEKGARGLYNVGTETKTMYELAKRTKHDVMPAQSKANENTPTNTTMDTTKLYTFLAQSRHV